MKHQLSDPGFRYGPDGNGQASPRPLLVVAVLGLFAFSAFAFSQSYNIGKVATKGIVAISLEGLSPYAQGAQRGTNDPAAFITSVVREAMSPISRSALEIHDFPRRESGDRVADLTHAATIETSRGSISCGLAGNGEIFSVIHAGARNFIASGGTAQKPNLHPDVIAVSNACLHALEAVYGTRN